MKDAKEIREHFERKANAMTRRPSVGQGTVTTRARYTTGLLCEVTEGPWRFAVDSMPKKTDLPEAPSPGMLARAALGSCLVHGYAMWAAKLGVDVNSIDVELQTDYDARGMYAVDDSVKPGYKEVRYIVNIQSDAPAADIENVVEQADRHGPILTVWADAQSVKRELRIERSGEAA